MRFSCSLVTAALLAALPLTAFAQTLGPDLVNADPFTLSVDPLYPAPFSTATINALSSNIDLNNATMDVSVAGKNIYRGNVHAVALPLGGAGALTVAKVVITANGAQYTQHVSILPEDVALIAEPRATAPPLYPGKPAEPLGGDVRVVAVAGFKDGRGTALDPTTLSYTWTVDGTVQSDVSGIGKNTVIVSTPQQYRERSVSVVIQDQDGALTSGASLTLVPQEPMIRLYENDPLLGIRYDRALAGGFAIRGAESTLYAAPFSFPTMNGVPALTWYIDGAQAQTGTSITLRPTGSGQGNASLSVAASNDSTQATADLSLIFGSSGGTNFFGL